MRRVAVLSLCFAAAIPVLPVVGEGSGWYLDNAAHVLEAQALGNAEGLFAFSERAELGIPVGQVSAPLPWALLGLAGRLGTDLVAGNAMAIVLANVLFAVAVSRLALRLYARDDVAWMAGALAASVATDTYGIGGSAGGMWPYRVANALVIFAFARGPGIGSALLLGGAFWFHTLSATVGGVALGVQAVGAAARNRRVPWVHVATGIGALAVGAGVWVPLLDPALHDFGGAHPYRWGEVVLALGFPVSPFAFPRGSVLLGGALSVTVWAVATLLVLVPRRVEDRSLALDGLAVLALLEICVLSPSIGGPSPLGPVPFRLHAFLHVALAIRAAAALRTLSERVSARVPPDGNSSSRQVMLRGAGIVMLTFFPWLQAVSTGLAGLREMPAAEHPELEAAYRAAVAEAGAGRVYVHDTFVNEGAPAELYWSHPGGLLAARHGGDILGSWYGISPSPVTRVSRSEDHFFAGLSRRKPREDFHEELLDRFDAWGVTALLTWDPQVVGWLEAARGFSIVSRHGPWTVLSRAVSFPPVTVRAGRAEVVSSEGALDVAAPGPYELRARKAANAWWAGAELRAEKATGLLVASGAGPAVLRVEDRARSWRWISVGALVVLGLFALSRLPATLSRKRERGAGDGA
ncbi:MAG: hypothetical protein FJ102_03550 [Deltaproteobacteria bacterium]|nr:hypothetical protein [Deltaproteobacteria bacterium]